MEPQDSSPGNQLWTALETERPLQVVGVVHALAALLAARVGFKALYLSGAGVANACFGLPDLGMTTLSEVAEEARRITSACPLPLLVDADTGWGQDRMVGRTVKELTRAGAAGMHLEDQVAAKRCGHRPGKQLCAPEEMCERVKAAVDARSDRQFVVMARTDAATVEGLEPALDRASRYVEAGADMIFAEALSSLDEYRQFTRALPVPILANITEFGRTPLLTREELASAGVRLILYPLSAFRAMNAAASNVYRTIRKEGSQKLILHAMQTREELYRLLNYEAAEHAQEESRP
jgi:methylisocitrate lyase